MPVRLIVNADDFGLTRGINRAVAELHDAGAVTSATLMAAGPAFEDAVTVARSRPALGIGCHLVLTDGRPVSLPRTIPSLMARDGHSLRPSLGGFLAALLTAQIDPSDVEREAVSQIERLQRAGLHVTHVDTHKHTHLAPPILAAILKAAERTGVGAIRNAFEQPWSFPLSNGTAARTSQLRMIQPLKRGFLRRLAAAPHRMQTTDGTLGISATGHLDEGTLRNLVAALPEGTWELVCHPGYNDPDLRAISTRLRATRETERKALLSVLSCAARERGKAVSPLPSALQLIHYGSLSSSLGELPSPARGRA